MTFPPLPVPIVLAPMGGGPSTPELAAGVCEAGGLGFLPAGYKTPDALRADIRALRTLTDRPFGVNVFVPPVVAADPRSYEAYAVRLAAEAERYGVALGEARSDDDAWDGKLELLEAERVAVASFTYGCPPPEVIERLADRGTSVWVTVTDVPEAREALAAGAHALVTQGAEAGAHRATWVDADDGPELGLLALLQLVGQAVDVPLIASGAIATGAAVAAVLCAGARAAQLGTAFLRCFEAGTAEAHREALARPTPTRLTRAFSGRRARSLVNRFVLEHGDAAPIAYPEIHHMTTPLRAAAREAGDPEGLSLWAGQAHELARAVSAGDLVRALAAEASEALGRASSLALAPTAAAGR
jgi:nitronate monooxygenase